MADIPSLGGRGEGWVALQLLLMAAIALAAVLGPRWPEPVSAPLAVVGGALGLLGVLVAVRSVHALGRSLTPFPRPTDDGELVQQGPYRFVRHPIYSSGILFLGGLSLVLSPVALVLTGVLAVVWALKSSVEERFLRACYPEYESYCERTRFRLVPYVF